MPERIPAGVAIRVPLQAFLASDHIAPATGLTTTIVITISKNGGAYAATNAAETSHEIASGSYYADLNTTDTGTVGPLFVRGAVATMDPITVIYNVVAATNAGFSALPNAAADAAGGIPISDAGGLDLDTKLANTNEVTAARMGALTDWINGGRLDLILDIIAADTTTDIPALIADLPTNTELATALGTADDAVLSAIAGVLADTDDIQTRIAAALTGAGNMKVDVLAVNGSTNAAANLARGTLGVVLGTVGAASTTTSIVTSALDPAAATIDQYKGRIVTFDRATTTANLRGQATDITASSALGVLTCTALTDAPVSGDDFSIT